jgi:hypothetical protein
MSSSSLRLTPSIRGSSVHESFAQIFKALQKKFVRNHLAFAAAGEPKC